MYLGNSYFSGRNVVSPIVTNINDSSYLSVSNCILDELFVANKTEEIIDADWQGNTILHATFDETINGGNVNYTLNNTSHIVVKRREKNTFDWLTIKVKEIASEADFSFSDIDRFAKNDVVYEYAIVPYYYGTSGNYSIFEIKSEFEGMSISEKDTTYYTEYNLGYCDTIRQTINNLVTPINSRYPKSIRNSYQNYDVGTASGAFIYLDDTKLLDNILVKNKKDIIDFLSNGKPKILKHYDGRMWLINVGDNVRDTNLGHYQLREISFDWTETGNCESAESLYYAGLLDITSEWW